MMQPAKAESVPSCAISSRGYSVWVDGGLTSGENDAAIAEYMEKLASERCTAVQFRNYLEVVYNKDVSKMRDSFVSQLNDLFYNGKGNEGKTYHDAFNAVTEYASNYSRKSASGRFLYSQFGQGARVNNRALRSALELATV